MIKEKLFSYKLSTSESQSGGPIYIHDGDRTYISGIHQKADENVEHSEENWGIRITSEIISKIEELRSKVASNSEDKSSKIEDISDPTSQTSIVGETPLVVKSKKGVPVKFSPSIRDFCGLLQDIDTDEPVELDLSTTVLIRVKEFFDHHKYKKLKPIQKPIKTAKFEEITDTWSANFLKKLSDQDLADLMMGASYLQCEILFDYGCAFIASGFEDIAIEELAMKYGIMEELTPELEEQIRKEHPYLFSGISPQLE